MLTEYVRAAVSKATYEVFEDDGTYYGEVPGLPGVWANEPTLEACRDELASAVEDWVQFRLSRGMSVPALDGIEIALRKVA